MRELIVLITAVLSYVVLTAVVTLVLLRLGKSTRSVYLAATFVAGALFVVWNRYLDGLGTSNLALVGAFFIAAGAISAAWLVICLIKRIRGVDRRDIYRF